MRTRLHFVALTFIVLLPGAAFSQSLADVARMEEARRSAIKGTAKVYTNQDLLKPGESAPTPATPTPTPTPTPAPAGTPASSVVPAEPPATSPTPTGEVRDEKYWRKRYSTAQESLNRNKVLLSALEARVNALNTDFVNTDDPVQRSLVQENLKAAMAELERMKTEVAAGAKALSDIQEEARKANVPPGWLR